MLTNDEIISLCYALAELSKLENADKTHMKNLRNLLGKSITNKERIQKASTEYNKKYAEKHRERARLYARRRYAERKAKLEQELES